MDEAEAALPLRKLGGVILLGCMLAACWPERWETEPIGEPPCAQIHVSTAPAQPNVVLIVNDTMRRDAAGIYGGAASTPHFDRFAERHLLFEHAFAQAPWTKPSIATLFTSLYPSQHRVESDPMLRSNGVGAGETLETDVLAAPLTTLAEVFGAAGYRTAAFVANPWLKARFGFAQGFEHYDDSFADEFGLWPPSGDALVDAALGWLRERQPGEPWFLYIHLLDSHGPYGSIDASETAGLRRRLNADPRRVGADAERIYRDMRLSDGTPLRAAGFRLTRALLHEVYRIGIERFDRLFGKLLVGLRKAPGWRHTAVIVTSDHGEAFFEHGWGLHGHGLHDDEAAIPLVARLPGVTPSQGRVSCLVGLVDVLPTLCVYLGIDCPESVQGWSFVGGNDIAPERRLLVTEGVMLKPRHRAIRNLSFKLLYEPDGRLSGRPHQGDYSFYDLESDPGEHFDVFDELYENERSKRTFERLKRALPRAVPGYKAPPVERAVLDPGERRRLEALGYLRD